MGKSSFNFISTILSLLLIFTMLFISISLLRADTYDDDTSLEFYWQAATGMVDHYNVYVSTDKGAYSLVGSSPNAPTQNKPYALPLVAEDGKKYQVKVEAEDPDGIKGPMSEPSDIVWCVLPQTISITSPNGGEVWGCGFTYNITWKTSGNCINHIHLLYSTDSGNTYSNTIVENTENDGMYEWMPVVPLHSTQVKIKAIAEDAKNNRMAKDESDGSFIIDSTGPDTPVVIDDGVFTIDGSRLHATWSSRDSETTIVEYKYAIGTVPSGVNIVGWTSVGTDTQITRTGLSLTPGKTYYFSVKAKNQSDLWSIVGISDGIILLKNVTEESRRNESNPKLEKGNGRLSIMVRWKNIGKERLMMPLIMVIENMNLDFVTIVNSDGTTQSGKPYYDYSNMTGDGILDSEEISERKQLVFEGLGNINDLNRFEFTTSFWAKVSIGSEALDDNNLIIQRREMKEGWNLVSFAVNKCFYVDKPPKEQPECVEMVNIQDLGFDTLAEWFSSIITPSDSWLMVIGPDGGMDSTLSSKLHSLKYMSPCSGYQIKIKEGIVGAVLSMEGPPFNPECVIPLQKGWNLVGFPLNIGYYDSNSPPNINGVDVWEKGIQPIAKYIFRSIDGKYDMVKSDYGAYNPNLTMTSSSLHHISTGCAYWLHMKEKANLVYQPETHTPVASASPLNQPVYRTDPMITRTSMLIYGNINGVKARTGNQLQILSHSGILCGRATVMDDGYYGITIVYGDDPDTLQIEGPEKGGELSFYINGEQFVSDLRYDKLNINYTKTYIPRSEPEIYWSGDKLLQRLDLIPKRLTLTKESGLAQNYPNPFNPETWIPFQLEEDASVEIKIYAPTGQLVRTLALGYRAAGFYVNKEKAAYWDGKNEVGETVSSGIYFYAIQAGKFTATKKMMIVR